MKVKLPSSPPKKPQNTATTVIGGFFAQEHPPQLEKIDLISTRFWALKVRYCYAVSRSANAVSEV
jgi:hypothetical protein